MKFLKGLNGCEVKKNIVTSFLIFLKKIARLASELQDVYILYMYIVFVKSVYFSFRAETYGFLSVVRYIAFV